MPDRLPIAAILAFGITQIIGYGTLYYSFSILAPDMAADFGWSKDKIFGLFSASLLIGGLVAPFIGRAMDRHGAGRIMALGSALSALSLLATALSTSDLSFIVSVVVMQVVAAMVLYQAAFATLVELSPLTANRSITYLTLIAGFASTIFWPVTSRLHEVWSWREVYYGFAAANALLCLPLHVLVMRWQRSAATGIERSDEERRVVGRVLPHQQLGSFIIMAAGFSLQGFALSAMLVHMVPMLTALGLGATAVTVGALFGPSQVLSRFINMVFGTGLAPVLLAVVSSGFIFAAILLLLLAGSWVPGALGFVLLLGLGSGISSIVQGSLPLYLFGSEGYGALTGKLSAIRLTAGAASPFVFSLLMERAGLDVALFVTVLLAAAAVVAFGLLRHHR
ncbi:MAG: hypothetical protein RLZZ444_4122 [Pseudomonadota bacterium]